MTALLENFNPLLEAIDKKCVRLWHPIYPSSTHGITVDYTIGKYTIIGQMLLLKLSILLDGVLSYLCNNNRKIATIHDHLIDLLYFFP